LIKLINKMKKLQNTPSKTLRNIVHFKGLRFLLVTTYHYQQFSDEWATK
jgi:hypothetical protein